MTTYEQVMAEREITRQCREIVEQPIDRAVLLVRTMPWRTPTRYADAVIASAHTHRCQAWMRRREDTPQPLDVAAPVLARGS